MHLQASDCSECPSLWWWCPVYTSMTCFLMSSYQTCLLAVFTLCFSSFIIVLWCDGMCVIQMITCLSMSICARMSEWVSDISPAIILYLLLINNESNAKYDCIDRGSLSLISSVVVHDERSSLIYIIQSCKHQSTHFFIVHSFCLVVSSSHDASEFWILNDWWLNK